MTRDLKDIIEATNVGMVETLEDGCLPLERLLLFVSYRVGQHRHVHHDNKRTRAIPLSILEKLSRILQAKV